MTVKKWGKERRKGRRRREERKERKCEKIKVKEPESGRKRMRE